MRRILLVGAYACVLGASALGAYELTAKSPGWLGAALPGRRASQEAERATRWNPATGITPLDRVLHEVEEALRWYGLPVRR